MISCTVADANLTPSRLRIKPAEAPASAIPSLPSLIHIASPGSPMIVAHEAKKGRQPSWHPPPLPPRARSGHIAGTRRRKTQEQAVKDLLASIGFKEVATREIPMLTAAPNSGEFCGETRLAGTRADVVVRLRDSRVMPIECKVSNSAVNSYKRIVHDTGGKAATWYREARRCASRSGGRAQRRF